MLPSRESSMRTERLPNLSLGIAFACAIAAGMMNHVGLLPCKAQTIIYQEGFNDDGEGSRYTVVGRGSDPNGPDGPGAWDLSTLVEKIGLVDTAPAKRAAILWTHETQPNAPDDFWTDDALQIFTRVVSWAIDGKQNTNIYMRPETLGSDSDVFLVDILEGAGHVLQDLFPGEDIPSDADLVINSSAGQQGPGPFLADKNVPVVSYFGTNHDGLAISKKGTVEAIDPAEINTVPGNENHPVLGGRTGTIRWTNDPSVPLEGIGEAPSGETVLATYVTPQGIQRPAIVLIEEGGTLIGGFDPSPEGAGFWIGGDMNLDFGDGFAATPDDPRVLEINPVNVSGFGDVQLTVALAATDADFEPVDYLRILVDPDNSGVFEVLAEFRGVAEAGSPVEKALRDTIDGTTSLRSDEFIDVTYDIPSNATELVIRFEAYSTFPNEVVGIDNLRVTSGKVVLQPGDADMDLDFDQLDLVQVSIAAKYLTGAAATWGEGDWNGAPGGEQGNPPAGDGKFDQLDIISALAGGRYLTGPYAAITQSGHTGDDQTSLVYDAETGELSVDAPAGVELTSINIDSAAGIFTGEVAQNLGGSFDNDADNNIFKATFGGSFGSVSFGQVAQAGLSEEFMLGDLSVIGSLAGGGGLGDVDLVYVPEPASALLLVLGAVVAAGNCFRSFSCRIISTCGARLEDAS